jgi:hypothetical protein
MTNYKNLLGKHVTLNYDNISGTVVDISNRWGDAVIFRDDGEGWLATGPTDDLYAEAALLGLLKEGQEPTFWWISPREIVSVSTTALVSLDEFLGEKVAPKATYKKVIPAKAVEPTAPMATKVLQMLRVKGNVTAIEAQGVLRCRDLPKRISELKQLGHNILRSFHVDHTGQRYARYTLG